MLHRILLPAFLLLGLSQAPAQTYPTAPIEPYLDLNFIPAERDSLFGLLEEYMTAYKALHAHPLPNDVGMALVFDPAPLGFARELKQRPIDWGLPTKVELPADRDALAFYPVYKLAALIKSRKISSVALTQLYIDRLKRYADTLVCVTEIMEKRALEQARRADAEIARGKYRGPLHGIPYGIKDLLAVPDTRTTWGAEPYREQVISQTATAVRKLDEAGAVLVAKLSLGALAMGDIWYGGVTKNPWNLQQGSSGSSAGSASATAAGLVAFSIGSETWGSIVSPSTRCGATGLRPTFGRVSRHGAMALSWSMDKIGPICRSALDCALVFEALRGADPLDNSTRDAAFNYSAKTKATTLRVGYLKTLFESQKGNGNDQKTLETLQSMGIRLEPVYLPADFPVDALSIILAAECAAAFDELTRSNRDDLLSDQRKDAWPNFFRGSRFIPAAEYVNANRIRRQLIEAYHQTTRDFDVIVSPSFGGNQLLMTNLTGHPCLVMPNGFNDKGTPTSITFLGRLYGEAALITLARAYQDVTDWEERRPPGF